MPTVLAWSASAERVDGVIDFVVPSPSGLNRIPYADQLASWRELADLVSDLRTELLSRNNYQKN